MSVVTVYDPERDGPLMTLTETTKRGQERWRLPNGERSYVEMRYSGKGPPFLKVRNEFRYPIKLFDDWARAQVTKPVLTVIGAVIERPEAA